MTQFQNIPLQKQDAISTVLGNLCGRLRNITIYKDYVEGKCVLKKGPCSSKLPMSEHAAKNCNYIKETYRSLPFKEHLRFIDDCSLAGIKKEDLVRKLDSIPTSFWSSLLDRDTRENDQAFTDKFYAD